MDNQREAGSRSARRLPGSRRGARLLGFLRTVGLLLSRGVAALAALSVVAPTAQAAAVVNTSTATDAFSSASRFFTHCANGYCWVAFHNGTTGPVIYSSPDGVTWTNQTPAPIYSFNPSSAGQWATRFSGNNVIIFATNPANPNRRYYRNATLNSSGTLTWIAPELDATGSATGHLELNALIAGGKPDMYMVDGAVFSAGDEALGTQLNGPTFSSVPPGVGPPAISGASGGRFSAGALHMTGGSDATDFIILRATTQAVPAAGSHRLISVKFDASVPDYVSNLTWYNVSLNGCPGCSPSVAYQYAESNVTEVKPGTDAEAHLRFAAVRDTGGNLHAVYVNRNDDVVHYRKLPGFNDSWTQLFPDVTQAGATVIDRVGLSAVPGNNLFLFYSKSDNGIYYRRFDGAAWGGELTVKSPNATTLRGALATMEYTNGCPVGLAWEEGTASPYNVMFSYLPGGCSSLTTSETASTVSVTGTGQFRMRFNTATGGGLDEFFDLEEDPAQDLAGGISSVRTLFGETLYVGDYYQTDLNTNGPKLDLLEATSTRVRVRQDAFYQNTPGGVRLAGVKAVGDYSVYPAGRMALRWNRRTVSAVASTSDDMNWGFHWLNAAPLNGTAFSETGPFPPPTHPGTDDFILAKNDLAGARTDFLTILHKDWTIANGYVANADSTDSGTDPTAQLLNPYWHDGGGLPAGANETWNFLTYFKPTSFTDNADANVTSRVKDYRPTTACPTCGPDPLNVTVGSGWNENTADADFFNESEAAYTLDLNPSTGLSFQMSGATTTRYVPFFKIRRWQSLAPPLSITVGGVTKTRDVDYRADVKPVSSSQFAQDLLWYSSLQSVAAVTTPDVGAGGTTNIVAGNFVAARYGLGASVTAANQRVSFPVSTAGGAAQPDFNRAWGAVEFWFQPTWASTDNNNRDIAGFISSVANNEILFQKLDNAGGNNLLFRIRANSTNSDCQISGANYTWNAGDWVQLRFEWDDSAPAASQQRVYVDGSLKPCTATPTDYVAANLNLGTNGVFWVGDINNAANQPAIGVFDELLVYGGSATPSAPLSHGGLTTNTSEYLADATRNSLLFLAGVDLSGRRGQYLTIGTDARFRGLNVTLATVGGGVAAGALQWQYWNGTGWGNLETVTGGFSDTTNSFTKAGNVSWSDPAGWAQSWELYSLNGGPDLYYVRVYLPNGNTYAPQPREALIKTDILLFQYCSDVTLSPTTFSFSPPIATAVVLAGFAASGLDSAVSVEWETASELDNLGFHLYRAPAADGPWVRITPSLIRGLGSSPEGKRYSWLDAGLANGTRYFYRLEDVDRSGLATAHGPVSAMPGAGAGTSPQPGSPRAPAPSPEPTPSPEGTTTTAWKPYGEPSAGGLRILKRTATSLTIELSTGGFYALAEADGTSRLHVPGFFQLSEPGLPQVPTRRAWLEVPAGSQVRVASVAPSELLALRGLRAAVAGAPQAVVERGTYQASFRRVRPEKLGRSLYPQTLARVLETAFHGETKKAYVELAPLRVDAASGQVVLARTLVVRLVFQGRARGERSRGGSRGRLEPGAGVKRGAPGRMLARLATRAAGLHTLSFEDVMSGAGSPLASSWLRLSRLGQPVAFHVEPLADRFGPGSTLYFVAEGPDRAYGNETVYELAIAAGGVQMAVGRTPRSVPSASVPSLVTTRSFEQNTNYLPALLNARDLWLWDFGLLAPSGRDYPFSVSSPTVSSGPASVSLDLQGGSDSTKVDPDHHVLVSLNGVPLGEARWDGLTAFRLETSVDSSILRDGPNSIRLDNLDTTGGFDSVVYLDRFSVQYPHALVAEEGRLEGRPLTSGLVQAAGFVPGSLLLDVSTATARWLSPAWTGLQLLFTAEAQGRYLAVSPEALLRAEVRPAAAAALRDGLLQADWIVIAPQELLPAAEPLVLQRQAQGLSARAVSLEQIRDEFGFGEVSPQAIRDFLAFAWHHWTTPSPRYVLLLGDATSDPKGFLPTASRKDLLPSPLTRSTFLWTASDPLLAAVNGDDAIPDLAIGRITAGSLAEAEAAVQKILAFEQAGQTLAGNAVLVADNPDLAGDFEANANDIATLLPGRPLQRIYLTQYGSGSAARAAVLDAFDTGAALVSYVGHGSQGVWASEGILRASDVALLQPQPRQPFLLTMTCSNGYFISPWSNALSERLVLAQAKGAIAAFSPSGLSLDDAAHLFHRALVQQLETGGHERIGDLVLAAQKDYADTGAFPELLSIYHLFADPALRILPETAGADLRP